MATKQEIVDGMTQLVIQAKRVGKLLDDAGDWDAKRPVGWTPREMFSHVAAVGGMIASMGPQMLAAPQEFDMTQSTDIGDLNAQTIASMREMTPDQLMGMIETNYRNAADWVQGVPDDQLEAPKTFAQMTVPASDIIANLGVLHGNHHLYEAALRVAF